jgi:hypothetical protein
MSEETNNLDIEIEEVEDTAEQPAENLVIEEPTEEVVSEEIDAQPEIEIPEIVIALEEKVADEVPTLEANDENIISSNKGSKKSKKVEAEVKIEKAPEAPKVAIYSSRNVDWQGVGAVKRGYNLVTQEQAAKWLTRIHVRLVEPEEIAREFGK